MTFTFTFKFKFILAKIDFKSDNTKPQVVRSAPPTEAQQRTFTEKRKKERKSLMVIA